MSSTLAVGAILTRRLRGCQYFQKRYYYYYGTAFSNNPGILQLLDNTSDPLYLDSMAITELIPKYERVKRAIIQEIERGQLAPGSVFPSEAELLQRYKVSRPTLVRSLQDLVREGWIYRRQGKGTFVADRSAIQSDETSISDLQIPLFVDSKAVRQSGDAREVLLHLMRRAQAALEPAGCSLVLRSIADTSPEEIDAFIGSKSPGTARSRRAINTA